MFDVAYFFDSFWRLLPALPMTLMLSVVSFAVGCVLGFLLALARLGRFAVLRSFVALFVSFFRGTPLLVQLFLFYYGIPIAFMAMGTKFAFENLDALYYALFVLSLHAAAYISEIARAALLSVNRGQSEAGLSLGFSRVQLLVYVILPQTFLSSLPNLLNFFVLQVKNTSLASIITVPELMGLADIESGRTSRFLEVYLMAALLYWALCVAFEAAFFALEKRLSHYKKRDNAR